MIKKYFGDKAFYSLLFSIAVPIMLQNGITNFVNLLDNIMVGSIGQYEMGGVSVTNQLIFVFNLCLFGAVSGVGIYTAQFHGKGDNDGLRHSLCFKIIISIIIAVVGIVLFLTAGDALINVYLTGEGSPEDIATTFNSAKTYLLILLVGLIPFAFTQAYSGTLRESGETVLPMKAGIIAVLVNLAFNTLLIYGIGPFPTLGVAGAAIATVLSRFVEAAIVIIWTHTHTEKCPYVQNFWSGFKIPLPLTKNMLLKAIPLLLNEAFWSMGIAFTNQCYSVRGLDVVAANNICQTFFNVVSVVFIAGGNAIGIIIGNMLGAGKMNEIKENTPKFSMFSFLSGMVVAVLCACVAPFAPYLFDATDSVRALATGLLLITAVTVPHNAIAFSSYFIMRSGGNALVTFIFDIGFMWLVSCPIGFILSRYTSLSILWLFFVVQGIYFIKGSLGLLLIKKDWWIKTLVD